LLLGLFAKLQKANIIPSSCLSVRTYGTTRLTLDWFSRNFEFQNFSKICYKI